MHRHSVAFGLSRRVFPKITKNIVSGGPSKLLPGVLQGRVGIGSVEDAHIQALPVLGMRGPDSGLRSLYDSMGIAIAQPTLVRPRRSKAPILLSKGIQNL